MMLESPRSLSEFCLDILTDNLYTDLCEYYNFGRPRQEIKQNSLLSEIDKWPFNRRLSEAMLELFDTKRILFDHVLLNFFTSKYTRLSNVKIENAAILTSKGLRAFRTHNLKTLEIHHLKKATLNELIACLNQWTQTNLQFLSVSNCSLIDKKESCIVIGLSNLKNLRTLDISYTKFNKFGLEIIVQDLPLLENLNISATEVRDLTPLRKCKQRLKVLSAYNLQSPCQDSVLLELTGLHYLDISNEDENDLINILPPRQDVVFNLIQNLHRFPNLESLDISGKGSFQLEDLFQYIESGNHQLKYLGLMYTNFCFYPVFMDSEFAKKCAITGTANEIQLLEALRRYYHREVFTIQALTSLYVYTANYTKPLEEVLELVIKALEFHPGNFDIQMAGTACLCNLTKARREDAIHPVWLGKVVDAALCAMETFPDKSQILKNSLLTLCNDWILKDVSFDRFRCIKLVMDTLIRSTDNLIRRIAVAICSMLAARISTQEISYFGSNPAYMSTLLNIIHIGLFPGEMDNMLRYTLSALWNLTDESPITCSMFLEKGGLDLYYRVLEAFEDDEQIQNKVLGLINNIAEVPHLRHKIMHEDFVIILVSLLFSLTINVSYFAAGILSHLASETHLSVYWEICDVISKEEVLESIALNVLRWKQPDMKMVAYRSFGPFVSLLASFVPEVQLWAMWAIYHVCIENPRYYCLKLIDENVVQYVQAICLFYEQHREVLKCKQNCNLNCATCEEPIIQQNNPSLQTGELNVLHNSFSSTGQDTTDAEMSQNSLSFDEDSPIQAKRRRRRPSHQQCVEDHQVQKVVQALCELSNNTLELLRIHYPYSVRPPIPCASMPSLLTFDAKKI